MTRQLFTPVQVGDLHLANRIVMAPMTRSRAIGNVPNELMAAYYAQRADAGLILTEGVAPCADGLGYARIPGLFTAEQVAGWRAVTDAVHAKGGKIVAQLMHTGRVGHPANLPPGGRVRGPSALATPGEMWTDTEGMQPHPVPEVMSESDIQAAIQAYVLASENAIAAGFDGVELHGANGYLIDQFLHASSNQRADGWGGDIAARCRFAVEVARAVSAAIGAGRVGMRISPYGAFNGQAAGADEDELYLHLAGELSKLGLAFLHVVDHSSMGAPALPPTLKPALRAAFSGAFILSGGYDAGTAEADLAADKGDLVAFGRPFISNPGLVRKLQTGEALTPPDFATFYTPGPAGYLDYPA
jgi:N-ethylmaleimide reductase